MVEELGIWQSFRFGFEAGGAASFKDKDENEAKNHLFEYDVYTLN